MKLVIMTKPTFFVEEDKILAALFDEGMDNLHLHKPGASPLYSERLLSLLPDAYYKKIAVHENFYLKNEYNLAGIHLESPDDVPPAGYKGRITRSCTAIDRLKEAKKGADYVFLKNIFGNTEEQSLPMQQIEDAARRGLIDKRVYALGGMSIDNMKIAKDYGFGGMVVCSDLWNRFDIHTEADFKPLIAHFERLRKAIG